MQYIRDVRLRRIDTVSLIIYRYSIIKQSIDARTHPTSSHRRVTLIVPAVDLVRHRHHHHQQQLAAYAPVYITKHNRKTSALRLGRGTYRCLLNTNDVAVIIFIQQQSHRLLRKHAGVYS